ncbi:hypothetical protein Raf01_20450 [Rugosimonospora africana]|uniref:Uncharacterized protein n=1 Tax=Rugosimonospora africana TaxID=556532 RepID=A0A8J3VQ11_9ACTN|nr:hypothetical protein Raf01_20450 [Rugosimonospora africana]
MERGPAEVRRSYRASENALRRAQEAAQARVSAAREARARARDKLAQAIAAEARAGTPHVDIIRISGCSRERVRQIPRAAGIEADT